MADRNKKLEENKILTIPPILENLYKIKAGLEGTDRDDHIAEVLANEEKVKAAILKLSAYGHEGIQLLVKQAKTELRETTEKLLARPDNLSAEAFSLRQMSLFNQRDLWLWFLAFFTDAEQAQREVEAFILEQNEPKLEEE